MESHMMRCPAVLFCCFWLAASLAAWGQRSENWLPVTAQDLQTKEVPGDSGAPAVQLYYADFRDDEHQSEFIYRRIKILQEGGKKYANIELQIPPHSSLADFQARTIHPDKTIIEFNGRLFEKVLAQYRGEKLAAKTLTMPDVTTGSLVEYKYRLLWNQYFNDPIWTVQHELYTVRESFWLRRYKGSMTTRHFSDPTQLSYVTSNMPAGVLPKDTGMGVELEVQNVPAFKGEMFMPPAANFMAQVLFFYGGREIESPEIFWRDVGQDWYRKTEHFIGNHDELKAVAARAMGGETDGEKRLKILYARAQETRNLSFADQQADGESGSPGLKLNENVMDVLRRRYGSQNEIAELFTALARAAGFSAQVLRASDRRDKVFDPKLLSEDQLGKEIVRVKVKDSDLFLDPGTKFCPFGLVTWTSTSAPALQLDKNGGSFIVVPTAAADKSVVRRTAELVLETDGSVRGGVTVEFKGNEALERRLEALNSDEAGRKQSLEDELLAWLPPGSRVQLQDVRGWELGEDSLVARFWMSLDGMATPADRRLALPASLFRSPEMEAFASAERKYPVYFPYTYEAVDKVNVRIPAGYRLESVPNGQDVKSDSTRFITTRSLQGEDLLLTRALVVNSIYFQPEQYQGLKSFFHKLRAADEEQVLLVTH
jgi:hypothetical protein